MSNESRPQWTSNISFIIATIGSAVGLGNIWRFPYVMGQNGGAIFLLVYLTLIFTICIIPLICELLLGKTYQKDNVGSFGSVKPKFKIFGWLCSITAILVPAFYFVVGGWILNYIWIYLINTPPVNYSEYFGTFVAKPYSPLFFTTLFIFLTAWFPFKGVNKGIEKANNIMMPIFLLMLLILAITSCTLPHAKEGLEFMFKPDFTKINIKMILLALGQSLFTLSIGMGALVTYGSYLSKKTNIFKSSYILIISDTIVAILAGIMIFPAVFSLGLTPTAGASLVFITLPKVFASLPFGNFTAITFFILLFFAAITSGISLIETPIATFHENFKISRQKATVLISSIIFLLSIPATLSFGVLDFLKIDGKTIFDLLDFVTANILMPLNTIIICIVVGWFMKPDFYTMLKNKPLAYIFNIGLKFIVPILLILLLLFGLNIIKL
ncbi:MAG: sodium-dependent transporter [Candidatus Gastranaerophilales bacterium]|nr:sodium-dependent transporter [Candidatus Gastranaerophilales bacterium]